MQSRALLFEEQMQGMKAAMDKFSKETRESNERIYKYLHELNAGLEDLRGLVSKK